VGIIVILVHNVPFVDWRSVYSSILSYYLGWSAAVTRIVSFCSPRPTEDYLSLERWTNSIIIRVERRRTDQAGCCWDPLQSIRVVPSALPTMCSTDKAMCCRTFGHSHFQLQSQYCYHYRDPIQSKALINFCVANPIFQTYVTNGEVKCPQA